MSSPVTARATRCGPTPSTTPETTASIRAIARGPSPGLAADPGPEDRDNGWTSPGRKGGCEANLQYGMAWANRLPAEFPVYPKAKLMEAAGAESDHCNLRAVSFVTNQPMQNVIDFYYTKALRSGFDAEHQLMAGEHVLGGVRQKDEGAYFITFAKHEGGGTAVDIIANNGR